MLGIHEEIYFWSGIMRDHADFQIAALSVREPGFIKNAMQYKQIFTGLRSRAEELIGKPYSLYHRELAKDAAFAVSNFINSKRLMLKKLLECDIEINFTPTFINHMINEALEFSRVLCLKSSNVPVDETSENIYLHKIWLLDASGHATAVACGLDRVESTLIEEAEAFKKTFDNLYLKAAELGQMLERACLKDGALERLNNEVRKIIYEFIFFLKKVENLRKSCKVLGSINPLLPDHMIREEEYYLASIKRAR